MIPDTEPPDWVKFKLKLRLSLSGFYHWVSYTLLYFYIRIYITSRLGMVICVSVLLYLVIAVCVTPTSNDVSPPFAFVSYNKNLWE